MWKRAALRLTPPIKPSLQQEWKDIEKKPLKNNHGSNLFWKFNFGELRFLLNCWKQVIYRFHHSSLHVAAIQLNGVFQKKIDKYACAKDQITGFFLWCGQSKFSTDLKDNMYQ